MGPDNMRQKDGKPLSLLINSINYGGGNLPEVELLQGQLFKLGIDARIKSQARPPWYEDNYHCATNGPVMFLRSVDWDGLFALFASRNVGGNFNWSCYANPEVDRLLAAGVAEFDQAKRKAIYLKMEQIAKMRSQLHLDEPFAQQYGRFIWNALHGDLGASIRDRRPVATEIAEVLPSTLQLALAALGLAATLGIVLGVVAAVRQNSWW